MDKKWEVKNTIELGIMRLRKKLRIVIEKVMQSYELMPQQFYVLVILKRDGAMKASELAAALQIKPSALTVLIDGLEKMEYVTREHSEQDRRVIQLSLTPKAENLVREILDKHNDTLSACYSDYSDEELKMFAAMLQGIEAKADELLAEYKD